KTRGAVSKAVTFGAPSAAVVSARAPRLGITPAISQRGGSPVVVEFDPPAPLAPIGRIPPVEETSRLAAWQDDDCAEVGICRPVVLAGHPITRDSEPRER